MQKLEQASKTKGHLVKRLDKSKEDVEDLRFQVGFLNLYNLTLVLIFPFL